MTNKTKIVFIGATSMSFGMNMLRDVFISKELHGSTLTMVSRNSETLAKWAGIAKHLNVTGPGVNAGRLAAPAPGDSFWANFLAFAFREYNEPITLGQLEPRKSDIKVDTSKWFWNGEQCRNPWLRRTC